MLKNWQTLGLTIYETKKSEASAASRLAGGFHRRGYQGGVANFNGMPSVTEILGLNALGAFLAITAEIVDQAKPLTVVRAARQATSIWHGSRSHRSNFSVYQYHILVTTGLYTF